MFHVSPNPFILNFPNFMLSYYALVYILGILTITFVLIKNKKTLNLKEEEIYDLLVFLLVGTILGARLFHVLFWQLEYYLQDPIKIFYIWQGGLSFHGGLLGAFIAAVTYKQIKKISILKLADTIIIPLTFFLALGRLANFMNSEILGVATNVPWCVVFQNIDNVCRHPIQIYAAAGRFALFTFLLFLNKKTKKPGLIFWTFILLISLGRFALDFLRDEPAFFGLLTGQWFSLILIVISLVAFKRLHLLRALSGIKRFH